MTAGALVIAAGFSRRFGADKRLFRLRDGRSMLESTVSTYARAFRHVAVVLRDSDSAVAAHLVESLRARQPIIVTTAHAGRGMAASLADGVRAVSDWDYVFVGLGDMPYVRTETLVRLDAAMRRQRLDGRRCIVQPRYEDTPGHPVGFSREFFAELLDLDGDEGARSVVRAHRDAVAFVDVDDPGVVTDLDQPPL
jgi:molybdenum cofactor cytidylyltransferase